ncbi:hypothetical protein DFR29_1367 [Tahibacter aquaticus]|uniref:DNA-binding CsgD family transcriptional regulator n=1 Tax=Tahibacter aquaticus TaxID=520092 RepID=A0A4R6YFX8_9GAMM|nr:hypothetical protein [Tahibacter aquaticus]TDR35356.1 hypothetical protein DFR29_1367 [Tahibacter aquaticus]
MGLDKSNKANNELDGLIGALYADLDGPEWSDAFLAGVCRATHSSAGAFVVTDLTLQRDALPSFYGAETVSALAYERRYAGHNPWRAARAVAHRHDGMILSSDDIMPVSELKQTVFYRDFLHHLGVAHGAGLIGLSDARAVGSLTLLRSSQAGPYTTEELRLLRSLAPHWSNACALRQRFDALSDQHRRLTAVVDHLALLVFLLDGEGRLVRTNVAADRCLSSGLGLKVWRGRLMAVHPASEVAMAGAVLAASAAPRMGAPPAHAFLLRDPAGGPIGHAAVHRLHPGGAAPVVVFVRLLEAAAGSTSDRLRDALRDAYGLTSGEAALAEALAKRHDLTRTASGLGIASATARTRLKAVFDKVGVENQTGLVAAVLALREVLGPVSTLPSAIDGRGATQLKYGAPVGGRSGNT